MTNDKITAGPATLAAWTPLMLKMPEPIITPRPSTTRSRRPNKRGRRCRASSTRVNADSTGRRRPTVCPFAEGAMVRGASVATRAIGPNSSRPSGYRPDLLSPVSARWLAMPGRLTHRRDMTPDDVSGNPSWPEGFTQLLADYERHLTAERDLSTHSVRAYIGDVADLLEHLIRLGHDELGGLDIRGLRSWLAKQQSLGKSRSTMARRATAARVFTAWAQRTGRISTDPGALLASPKPHKHLPGVMGQADTRAVLDAAAVAAR